MPSADRVVSAGIAMCCKSGLTRRQALLAIMAASESAARKIQDNGQYDITWLQCIHDIAAAKIQT